MQNTTQAQQIRELKGGLVLANAKVDAMQVQVNTLNAKLDAMFDYFEHVAALTKIPSPADVAERIAKRAADQQTASVL